MGLCGSLKGHHTGREVDAMLYSTQDGPSMQSSADARAKKTKKQKNKKNTLEEYNVIAGGGTCEAPNAKRDESQMGTMTKQGLGGLIWEA